jgi:hypothetical protein
MLSVHIASVCYHSSERVPACPSYLTATQYSTLPLQSNFSSELKRCLNFRLGIVRGHADTARLIPETANWLLITVDLWSYKIDCSLPIDTHTEGLATIHQSVRIPYYAMLLRVFFASDDEIQGGMWVRQALHHYINRGFRSPWVHTRWCQQVVASWTHFVREVL